MDGSQGKNVWGLNRIGNATKKRHKIGVISAGVKGTSWEILPAFQFAEVPEVLEDGETLEENSLKKAKAVSDATGLPTVADDTGLFVDALGGAPGIFAARYAGEGCTYRDNVEKLLRELKGQSGKDRHAVFRTVMAVYFPGEKPVFLEGEVTGIITEVPCGGSGFGYDPIFQPDGCSKVFAEMTAEEKNRLSHRGRALEKVREYLRNKVPIHPA